MADIALTAARIAAVFPDQAEIVTGIAGATITAGAAVYWDSSGNLALSDGSAAGTAIVAGIALTGGGAGQAISVLKRGHVYGFTLAGAYHSAVYLSDTDAGILGDAAGTVSVVVGRVVPLPDSSRTKVVYVNTPSW